MEELEKKALRVYQLIRRRTLESCMANALVSVLSATITAPHEHSYHYTAEEIIFQGWKKVVADTTNCDTHFTYLKTLKQNVAMHYQKIKANLHVKELKMHYTEARLIQLLEENGIGRPSTFAALVTKIQERGYVKKETIKGQLVQCIDYELNGKEMIKITLEKEFGNEKNKLIIQPVGIMALEFLVNHFDKMFQYSYTKRMEDELDAVSKGEKQWTEVCRACYSDLKTLSAAILKRGKETIRIDAEHVYMIGKYGPVIKCTGPGTSKDKTFTFKPVKKDIDLNKLRRGEYTLEDILEQNALESSIGLYKEIPVYIKAGKFGAYLEWNGATHSLKHLKQPKDEITLDDVLEILYDNDTSTSTSSSSSSSTDTSISTTTGNSKILRVINDNATLRRGNYGNYIFYQNKKMKKPRFLKLDDFKGGDYLTCDLSVLQEWFKEKYKID